MNASAGEDPPVRVGHVEPHVAAEFPGLELRFAVVSAPHGPSPPILRRRLRELSDRYDGARVLALRTQPVARAYRAFFRQIGLEPDVVRIPSEAAAVARLAHGGFPSRDHVSDALLVAVVETGVGVWAIDAAAVQSATLGIRTSVRGEVAGFGTETRTLEGGRLVIADARRVHALLFGPALGPARRGPAPLLLYTIGVPGVPAIYLDEALWLAGELLGGG